MRRSSCRPGFCQQLLHVVMRLICTVEWVRPGMFYPISGRSQLIHPSSVLQITPHTGTHMHTFLHNFQWGWSYREFAFHCGKVRPFRLRHVWKDNLSGCSLNAFQLLSSPKFVDDRSLMWAFVEQFSIFGNDECDTLRQYQVMAQYHHITCSQLA